MDPLADLRPENSSFAYCGNNPISRIDPLGLDYIPGGDGSEENPYVWDTDLVCKAGESDLFDNWVNFLGFGNEREGWSGAGEYTQQAMSVWQNQGYHALNTWQQQNRPDFELAGKVSLGAAYLPSMVMGGIGVAKHGPFVVLKGANYSRIVAVKTYAAATTAYIYLSNYSSTTSDKIFRGIASISSSTGKIWNATKDQYLLHGYYINDSILGFSAGYSNVDYSPSTMPGILGWYLGSISSTIN